jgi:hypothetical protein
VWWWLQVDFPFLHGIKGANKKAIFYIIKIIKTINKPAAILLDNVLSLSF